MQTPLNATTDPAAQISNWRSRFEKVLDKRLPAESHPPQRLHLAMRYSALAGGKRVRPLLVYAAGKALNLKEDRLDGLACAVELMHAYSLIHDDLPAMDDDDLRRGRPSCHCAFDEATAILAGDALQALAFQTLAEENSMPPQIAVRLIRLLALACGSTGMAGGQMLDLSAAGNVLDIKQLETTHALKTGALIHMAVVAPGYMADADTRTLAALGEYGECVGLGFQICDDILDVTGDVALTGKSTHTDAQRDLPTFPSLIGIQASQQRAGELRDRALQAAGQLHGDTDSLLWLAEYLTHRDH